MVSNTVRRQEIPQITLDKVHLLIEIHLRWPPHDSDWRNLEENFTAQSMLLYGYGAVKELNESSHFSLVVVFMGLKHFSFVDFRLASTEDGHAAMSSAS